MRLAVVACFLDEEIHLPQFLRSMDAQLRPPDHLLLIDDGSSDRSAELAHEFASTHPYARVLRRARRPRQRDRLAHAAVVEAFLWGVAQLEPGWEIVVKMDGDLELSGRTLLELERRFEEDPQLGIAGPFLSVRAHDGHAVRERCASEHVRGPTKFYRRACFEEVYPRLPVRLGWDTLDEIIARMRGWRTRSFAMPDGDPIHLRVTGSHDGVLRGHRRDGVAMYAWGASPWWALIAAARRVAERPRVLGALHFLAGWTAGALRRDPRADAPARIHLAREHRRRLRAALLRRAPQ